ncbi:MAG: hypothetical protein AAGF10_03700, partial [Verrucomicrobiota bacterium]
MYALKRQLRVWGHELATFWDRIPFVGRVLLGAVICVGLVYTTVRYAVNPLDAEITELNKDLEVPTNLNPEEDEEITMNLDRAEKLKSSLSSWKNRLETLSANTETIGEEAHLETLQALKK